MSIPLGTDQGEYMKLRRQQVVAATAWHTATALRQWSAFLLARARTDATATAEDARAFITGPGDRSAGYMRELATMLRAYYRWRMAGYRSPANPFEDLWAIPNAPVDVEDPDSIAYLDFRGALSSTATVDTMRRTLVGWERFMAERGKRPAAATFNDASAYLGMHNKSWGASTVFRVVSTLRGFHTWMEDAGRCTGPNPWKMRAPTPSRSIPDPLRPEEWQRLEAALVAAVDVATGRDRPRALRRWAAIRTLFATGCRSIELRRLRVEDLDFEAHMAHLYGKGGRKPKERKAPFGPRTAAALQVWLAEGRPYFLRGDRGWVFPSETGAQWSASAVDSATRTAVRAAGVGRRLYPHLLRHSYATKLLEGGATIREVQDLLGHASLATTQIYTHVRPERLHSAYTRAFGGEA